jgi:hypothetical protein
VLEPIGRIAMVFDSEGVAQVKIDEGEFTEYRALDYGYGHAPPGGTLPNLVGRWALTDTQFETQFNGSVPPGAVLPLVFDIELASGPVQPGQVEYQLFDPWGDFGTTIRCEDNPEAPAPCIISNPEYDDGSHGFMLNLLSPQRALLTDTGPMLSVGVAATGVAVRID